MTIYCILKRACRVGKPADEPKYMSFHSTEYGAKKELEFDYHLAIEDAKGGSDYYREEVRKNDKGYFVNCYSHGELTSTEYYYIEPRYCD